MSTTLLVTASHRLHTTSFPEVNENVTDLSLVVALPLALMDVGRCSTWAGVGDGRETASCGRDDVEGLSKVGRAAAGGGVVEGVAGAFDSSTCR